MGDPVTAAAGITAGSQFLGNMIGKSGAGQQNRAIDAQANPLVAQLGDLAKQLLGQAGDTSQNPTTQMYQDLLKNLGNPSAAETGLLGMNDQFKGQMDTLLGQMKGLYDSPDVNTNPMEVAANRAMLAAGRAARGMGGTMGSSGVDARISQMGQDIYGGLAKDIASTQIQQQGFRAGLLGQMGDTMRGGYGLMSNNLGTVGQLGQGRQNLQLGAMGGLSGNYNNDLARRLSAMQGAGGLLGQLLDYYNAQRPK